MHFKLPIKHIRSHHFQLFILLLIPLPLFLTFKLLSSPSIDECFEINGPGGEGNPNTRSLCKMRDVCVETEGRMSLLGGLQERQVVCNRVTPHWVTTHEIVSNCTRFRHQWVHCAHGLGWKTGHGQCPKHTLEQNWIPNRIAVIVPEYEFPDNLYHYGTAVTTMAHAVRARLWGWRQGIDLVIGGKQNRNPWQRAFAEAVLAKLQRDYGVTVKFRGEGCWKRAVVLGKRGHVNVWPFLNASDTDGVNTEALWIKDAVYDHVGLETVWKGKRIRVPEKRLAYARRWGDGRNGGRVFGREDESWFGEMLHEEAAKGGLEIEVWDDGKTWEEQVKRAERAGVVVGIHGANLVNSWFVRPFGAMVEVLGGGLSSICYVKGSNGGLAYWRWQSDVVQGGKIDCELYTDCRGEYRKRGVVIGGENEKLTLRKRVSEAVMYLNELHEIADEDGTVQVRYDRSNEVYRVVGL